MQQPKTKEVNKVVTFHKRADKHSEQNATIPGNLRMCFQDLSAFGFADLNLNPVQSNKLKQHLAVTHKVLPSIHHRQLLQSLLKIPCMSYLPNSSSRPAEEKNN